MTNKWKLDSDCLHNWCSLPEIRSFCVMSDRRRVNGPPGGTAGATYAQSIAGAARQPQRTRKPNELRKICVSIIGGCNSFLLTWAFSSSDWSRPCRVRLCIPRARSASTCCPKNIHSLDFLSQADLLSPRAETGRKNSIVLTEPAADRSCQVCPICSAPTERLHP